MEEVGEKVLSASQPTRHNRTLSYTAFEDVTLVRAWECALVSVMIGNDQSGKKYWQRVKDKYHCLMLVVIPSPCSLGSLQGQYDVIK